MIKYLLILAVIGYVFRRILFTPIPGSSRAERMENDKTSTKEFTDYEEIDD